MKAPEKIYSLPRQGGDYAPYWKTDSQDGFGIEHVRTDAFMKKAENFLEMLGYGFTITDNITHKNYDKEQLIEDFRKYIEGE